MPPLKRKSATTVPVEKTSMQIVWIPRSKINFWKENPRRNTTAAPKLATLLRGNGLRSPLNLWDKDMTVYKGNTTLKALDLIKAHPEADDKFTLTGDFLVPCILHHFENKDAAEAYGVGDNKGSEFAEWDEDALARVLSAKGIKPIIKNTGFTQKEVSNLLWVPDAAKLDNIDETSAGMVASVKVLCRPEDKEGVLEVLRAWAADSGFEGLAVK